MGLFTRRQADADAVTVAAGGRPSPEAIPARLRVGAVTSPSTAGDEEAVLASGVLLCPAAAGSAQLVQVVVRLPRASWPKVDQELPAVIDPARPGSFGVTWAVVAVVAGVERTVTATEWQDPDRTWDPGPNGEHDRALAAWLSRTGYVPDDFAGAPALVASGVSERLAALGWPRSG